MHAAVARQTRTDGAPKGQAGSQVRSTAPALAPRGMPAALLSLQRTIGNRSTGQVIDASRAPRAGNGDAGAAFLSTTSLRAGHVGSPSPGSRLPAPAIQTKLAMNAPGDTFEQEANRVADQVLRMPMPGLQRTCARGGECAECQMETP